MKRLESMTTAGQWNATYTVLQMQATPTAKAWTDISTSWSTSLASSPLLSTKANFDMNNVGWCKQNLAARLKAQKLVVILNDFIDGMTVYTAANLIKDRIGRLQAQA